MNGGIDLADKGQKQMANDHTAFGEDERGPFADYSCNVTRIT